MSQVQRASSKLADLAGIPVEDRPVSFPAGGLPRPNMKGYTPSLPQTKLYRQVAQGGGQEVPQGGIQAAAPPASTDAPAWADPALRAGLTMMQSKNPNALGAIAEGGLAAVQSLAERKRSDELMGLKQKEMEEERDFRRQKLAVEMMKSGKPEYVNVFNPETGARKTVASGSEEFGSLLSQGFIVGDPSKERASKYETVYNPEDPSQRKSVVVGSPEHTQLVGAGWLGGDPELKKLSKPETTVHVGGKQEGKYGETVGKAFADLRIDYMKAAEVARGTVNRVSAMRRLNNQISTGALEPAKLAIKQLVKGMGADLADFGIDDNTGAAEAYKSLAGRFMMDFIQQTKGAISERENDLFQSFSPSLAKTPEGNAILLDWADRLAKRQMQVNSLASAYAKKEGQLDEGWSERLDAYHEANPILSDDDIKQAESIIGTSGQDTVTTDGGAPPPEASAIDPDAASRDEMINFLQRKQSR